MGNVGNIHRCCSSSSSSAPSSVIRSFFPPAAKSGVPIFDTLGNDMTKEENNQYFKVARRRRINNWNKRERAYPWFLSIAFCHDQYFKTGLGQDHRFCRSARETGGAPLGVLDNNIISPCSSSQQTTGTQYGQRMASPSNLAFTHLMFWMLTFI